MTAALAPIMWTLSCDQPPVAKADWPEIINRVVNNGIDPLPGLPEVTAPGRYWPKSGWCIDYAWTKREELLLRGYHAGELLLCEVELDDGTRHMVLIVNGVVLDNINQQIVPLAEMRYRVVMTQSAGNPDLWESA